MLNEIASESVWQFSDAFYNKIDFLLQKRSPKFII